MVQRLQNIAASAPRAHVFAPITQLAAKQSSIPLAPRRAPVLLRNSHAPRPVLQAPRAPRSANTNTLAAPVASKHVLQRLLEVVDPHSPDGYGVKMFFAGHAIAPDTSRILEIKRLPGDPYSFCFCILPAGTESSAVMHPKLRESWWVVRGKGEIARQLGRQERVDTLVPGHRVEIPLNSVFQFRATGSDPLVLLIRTSPSWPGPQAVAPQPQYRAPWARTDCIET